MSFCKLHYFSILLPALLLGFLMNPAWPQTTEQDYSGEPVSSASKQSLQREDSTANSEDADSMRYLLTQTIRLGNKRVEDAFFSPNGRHIVTLSSNNSIELHSRQTGKRLRVIPTQEHEAVSLVLHPGGELAATGGRDDTIRVWDTRSTLTRGVLRGHLSDVVSLSLDVTGEMLLSGSQDGAMILWNMKNQKLLNSAEKAHTGELSSVAFHPSGGIAVSGGEDGKVRIWSIPDLKPVHSFTKHRKPVSQVGFTVRGDKLLTASEDGILAVWEWEQKRLINEITMKQPVSGFGIQSDGKKVVVGTKQGRIRVYDLEQKGKPRDVDSNAGSLEHVHFDPSGSSIIAAMANGLVQVWEMGASLFLKSLRGHERSVESLDFSSNGTYLISSSSDKTARIWDVDKGVQVRSYELKNHRVQVIEFSPSGNSFATGGADSTIGIWDSESGNRLKTLSDHKGKVNAISYHPNGQALLSGGSDRQWILWDIESEEVLLKNRAHEDQVQAVRFSPDGKLFATAGSDKLVKLWSYPNGDPVLTLKGHRKAVVGLSFNAEVPLLATASQDNSVLLWDLRAPIKLRPPKRLKGHSFIVDEVLFSRDGKTVLTASRDKTARLWESATAKMLRILHGESRPLLSAAISPDNRMIALGSLGTEITLLSFPDDLPQLKPVFDEEGDNKTIDGPSAAARMVKPEQETVILSDLSEGEKRPMSREELQVYMTPPKPVVSKRHLDLQEKLNVLLKDPSGCEQLDNLQELALLVLDITPDDQAAYHALIKTGAMRGDLNLAFLAVHVGSEAKLPAGRYDYLKPIEIRNIFKSWREEVFNPIHHRGERLPVLAVKNCEGDETRMQLPESARSLRLPNEFQRKLTRISKIIEFRDFVGISDREFSRRIFHEISRVLHTSQPYPPSRLPLKPGEAVPEIRTGTLNLNLQGARVWKSEGIAEFELRKDTGPWQSFRTDQDGIVVMRLPRGNYYLRIGRQLEQTFFLDTDAVIDMVIR